MIEHPNQKLKQLWYYILPKLYDFGFFILDFPGSFFAPAGVATPPDGIPPCSSPTRIRARAQQPGNFADSPARVDQLLGIPISRYITRRLRTGARAIRLTPPNVPIDLIFTPGGLVLATEQIARALIRIQQSYRLCTTCLSGGTMLALASDGGCQRRHRAS